MNEFTKEELNHLGYVLTLALAHEAPIEWEHLHEKIQSMIDNYCEHEPRGDWHVCVDKCEKCGVICE